MVSDTMLIAPKTDIFLPVEFRKKIFQAIFVTSSRERTGGVAGSRSREERSARQCHHKGLARP